MIDIIPESIRKALNELHSVQEDVNKRIKSIFDNLRNTLESDYVYKRLKKTDMPSYISWKVNLLFFLIQSGDICKDVDGLSDSKLIFESWLKNHSNLSFRMLNNSCNKKVYYENIVDVLIKDYYNDDYTYTYTYNSVLELLEALNKKGIGLSNEIEFLKNQSEYSEDNILRLVNIIESIVIKCGDSVGNKIKQRINYKDCLCIDAAISKLILFSDFDESIKILSEKSLLIPNRHIIVHKSLIYYNNYNKTLDILIDMICNILEYYNWISDPENN